MKSGFPYLVDVKITERCPFGCPMCYQSSTKKGKDADISYLTYTLPKFLKTSGVFEVAFGGGEPTFYKKIDPISKFVIKLAEILEAWKKQNFVVGFTTKNYNLHKLDDFHEIIKNTDSIAISVNSISDVEKALIVQKAILDKGGHLFKRVYFQMIFGLMSYEEFLRMLDLIDDNPITLLGYKRFGFGASNDIHVNQYPDEWLDVLKNRNRGSISADSVFIQMFKQKLLDINIPERWLVAKEGETTCYIDAVKQRLYPSSFSDHPGFDLTENVLRRERFLELFQKLSNPHTANPDLCTHS